MEWDKLTYCNGNDRRRVVFDRIRVERFLFFFFNDWNLLDCIFVVLFCTTFSFLSFFFHFSLILLECQMLNWFQEPPFKWSEWSWHRWLVISLACRSAQDTPVYCLHFHSWSTERRIKVLFLLILWSHWSMLCKFAHQRHRKMVACIQTTLALSLFHLPCIAIVELWVLID